VWAVRAAGGGGVPPQGGSGCFGAVIGARGARIHDGAPRDWRRRRCWGCGWWDETAIADLERKRRTLLDLYDGDGITPELFREEEQRLATQLEVLRSEQAGEVQAREQRGDLSARFEEVVAVLTDLDMDAIWQEATDEEKRVLVERFVDEVAMYPDHLEVAISGTPRLNFTLDEVGLEGLQTVGASGGTRTPKGCEAHWDLNPARLPVPPRSRRSGTYR
jgi:hypothetical protein